MDHDLISSWLGLPAGSWPPDHYTLLGLPRGQADAQRVEQHVHERLARLRPYQLNHPDQVTEAMNRLAQAFTCLTDPEAKRVYDAVEFPNDAPSAAPEVPTPAPAAGEEITDPLAWLFGPWSQALPAGATTPGQILGDWVTAPPPPRMVTEETDASQPDVSTAASAAFEKVSATAEEPADPHHEAAHLSVPARRGLGTKRALYHRIAVTRRLLRIWRSLESHLGRPARKLTRIADAAELTRQLAELRALLESFPPILGGAGQPGYFVNILARQQMIVPTFRALLSSQREELARDWRAGNDLLRSHLRFLRGEVRAIRRQGRSGRLLRAACAGLRDQPGLVLLTVGLFALAVALFFHFNSAR